MLTIQRWGNSLAVRIPAAIARAAQFRPGQEVEVATGELGVTVKPTGSHRLTLAEKLTKFDPAIHGGEAMANAHTSAKVS
ncbi:AbrB/MazE/SpoVT family DNA-binding domain-containing protein [Paraburkholderia aspalathi]|uniref:AbrB/MazE/SpoVT family DNA-binding domain-containing protein n=1 Tax=Paraburkholderia aspalathi TaxID=1324617 RepID=UPI0038BB5D4F